VKSTRYLLLSVEPGADHSFEISKSMRMEPASYNCTLEVSGPGGVMFRETRRCQASAAWAGPASWTGAAASEVGAARSAAQKSREDVIWEEKVRENGIWEDEGREDEIRGEETRTGLQSREIVEEEKKPEEIKKEEIQAAKEGREKAEVFSAQEVRQAGEGAHPARPSGTAKNLSADLSLSSPAEPKTRLVGSAASSSRKYHQLDCRYAQNIKPENRIYFASEEDAKRQNYQPCKVCSP
jgi:hypothetical protein